MKDDSYNKNNECDENRINKTTIMTAFTPALPLSLPSHKQLHPYQDKLLRVKDFNETFELVKSAVDSKFKMHRAGLSLILQVLPTQLGAYHILGSNMIIINKRILDIIKSKKSLLDYNSYLFMVLCHEYLHSFGIVDEMQVRRMTYNLCMSLLGKDHSASIMARYQPWDVFPELKVYQTNNFETNFEIIKNFDKTTQSYIN
ncbi:MAG: hypothetical protein M3Z01_04050 [Thermoproteota archaeon]|nr:hypothetical protein [Thermoproteota archaeon]